MSSETFLKLLAEVAPCVEVLKIDLKLLSADIIDHDGIYCTKLKKLSLVGEGELGNVIKELQRASQKYPNLESLELIDFDYFLTELDQEDEHGVDTFALANLFPKLKSFCLHHGGEDRGDDNDLVCCFLKSHPFLKQIAFDSYAMNKDTLAMIVRLFPDLEVLSLKSFVAWEDDIMDGTSIATLKKEGLSLKHLRKLHLQDFELDDDLLEAFINQAISLEELCLQYAEEITDLGLFAVAAACPKLRVLHLDVFLNKQISDAGIERIVEHCHDIQIISIDCNARITDFSVLAIAWNCRHLNEIHLHECLSLTDKSIIKMAEICHQLTHVVVIDCVKLTEKSITQVFLCCRNLKVFKAKKCLKVNDFFLCSEKKDFHFSSEDINTEKQFSTNCSSVHSQIHTLDFAYTPVLTNHNVLEMTHFCKNLRILDLQSCELLNNSTVKEIVMTCVHLQRLCISGERNTQTTRLTDASLFYIADYACNLLSLMMMQNYNITAEGLFEVVKRCPQIYEITVSINDDDSKCNMVKGELILVKEKVPEKTVECKFDRAHATVQVFPSREFSLSGIRKWSEENELQV